jgi:hypothetical protein
MARFRNVNTGAVVSVGDDLQLDSEWESVSDGAEKSDEKKAPAKRAAKADDKS